MKLSVVILAAGKGTRMRSKLPKVLHCLAGKPLVQHVIDRSRQLGAQQICLVYGHGGEQVQQTINDSTLHWVEQAQQLGTGHAVQQALPNIAHDDTVLILYGDVPLVSEETLHKLLQTKPADGIALLTVCLSDPTGYGRIVRNAQQQVTAIVEHKDATEAQRAISEVNTGILAANGADLHRWLNQLQNNNVQGEYYLTDIIAMAKNEDKTIAAVQAASAVEVEGVNDRVQLSRLERAYQALQAEVLMRNGATLLDPARLDIRGDIQVGSDTIIDVNVVLEGKVTIGEDVSIGPNCYLKDCYIGQGTIIKANTVIESAVIGEVCTLGPFARIRPDTTLERDTHIGNFVEIKKSRIDEGSKVNHLSYIGDAVVGKKVNIGAGTITCNYDGANKYQTVIEDHVFVGSDTQLVAPVTVGTGATIGAGTTVTSDIPAEQLCISRVKQRHISGWQRPVKNKS